MADMMQASNAAGDRLPTRAEWDAATPRAKGFMSYWFSAWEGSEIPSEDKCPFAPGSPECAEFDAGVHAAVIAAQDMEE
jgi:hypothetical protein